MGMDNNSRLKPNVKRHAKGLTPVSFGFTGKITLEAWEKLNLLPKILVTSGLSTITLKL